MKNPVAHANTARVKVAPKAFSKVKAIAAIAACCGAAAPAWAQTSPPPAALPAPPTAGQLLREAQPPTLVPAPPAVLQQRIDEQADASATPEGAVNVKTIEIKGNSAIPTDQLEPLVAQLLGGQRSLRQLNAGARRITAYYRAQGFVVARAYLPAQDVTDGVVTIAVVEGRIASYKITNDTRLSGERVAAHLGAIAGGAVIQSAQIDRGLLLLQDTPGVASARASLQPGAAPGSSDLLIELKAADALTGYATLDNYGSRATGEQRLGAGLSVASPLGIGDLASASLLSTGAGLNYARLAYQAPVDSDGLRLGLAAFALRYSLGQEFAALQAGGSASSTSVFASDPLVRSA